MHLGRHHIHMPLQQNGRLVFVARGGRYTEQHVVQPIPHAFKAPLRREALEERGERFS